MPTPYALRLHHITCFIPHLQSAVTHNDSKVQAYMLQGLSLPLLILFEMAITVGFCRVCLLMVRGQAFGFASFLTGFKRFGLTLKTNLLIYGFFILCFLIMWLILFGFFSISTWLFHDTNIIALIASQTMQSIHPVENTFIIIFMIIFFALICFMNWVHLCTIVTALILADEQANSARDALKKTRALLRGEHWRLFRFLFGYLGWSLLSLLPLLMGFHWFSIALIFLAWLFLYPYIMLGYTHFYETIKHKQTEATHQH